MFIVQRLFNLGTLIILCSIALTKACKYCHNVILQSCHLAICRAITADTEQLCLLSICCNSRVLFACVGVISIPPMWYHVITLFYNDYFGKLQKGSHCFI